MPNKQLKKLAFGAIFFLMAVQTAQASLGSSANYKLETAEVTNAAGSGSSANYVLPDSTAGGTIDAKSTSASYRLCAGFVEETGGTCVATVTPPPPPPLPPLPPPPVGGGTGGSGYNPPKKIIITPTEPAEPVEPTEPTEPAQPTQPAEEPGVTTPGGEQPGEELPTTEPEAGERPQETQPAVQKPATGQVPSTGRPAAEGTGDFINGRPISFLPVIPGMGDFGYEEIPGTPSFILSDAKEEVWCGKSACEGEPFQYFKPVGPERRIAKKASWHAWFVMSLAIAVIMLWVQYLAYAPEPGHRRQKRPGKTRRLYMRRGKKK